MPDGLSPIRRVDVLGGGVQLVLQSVECARPLVMGLAAQAARADDGAVSTADAHRAAGTGRRRIRA